MIFPQILCTECESKINFVIREHRPYKLKRCARTLYTHAYIRSCVVLLGRYVRDACAMERNPHSRTSLYGCIVCTFRIRHFAPSARILSYTYMHRELHFRLPTLAFNNQRVYLLFLYTNFLFIAISSHIAHSRMYAI